MNFLYHTLKSGGTNDHIRWVNVPCIALIVRSVSVFRYVITIGCVLFIYITVTPAHAVTSIKQSPVLKG